MSFGYQRQGKGTPLFSSYEKTKVQRSGRELERAAARTHLARLNPRQGRLSVFGPTCTLQTRNPYKAVAFSARGASLAQPSRRLPRDSHAGRDPYRISFTKRYTILENLSNLIAVLHGSVPMKLRNLTSRASSSLEGPSPPLSPSPGTVPCAAVGRHRYCSTAVIGIMMLITIQDHRDQQLHRKQHN